MTTVSLSAKTTSLALGLNVHRVLVDIGSDESVGFSEDAPALDSAGQSYTLFIHYYTYVLQATTIKLLHFVLLDPRTAPMGRMIVTEFDDPQCDPLPPLSLQTSNFQLLQIVYCPLLQIFHVLPQNLFPLFHGKNLLGLWTAPATMTTRETWAVRKTHNLECVEVWERFARNDQI